MTSATAATLRPSPPARPSGGTAILDGARLRHLRDRQGLSQEHLAIKARISLTTMQRLENQPTAPCRCRTPARLTPATQP